MDEIREETRDFNFWVLVRPAGDIAGKWVAHCLDLDVVSQGESIKHALDMVVEATAMVLADDIKNCSEPGKGRRAPDKFWTLLWKTMKQGVAVPMEEVLMSKGPAIIAAPLQLRATITHVAQVDDEPTPVGERADWVLPMGAHQTEIPA